MELPVDVIQRARHRLIADRRPHGLATDRALQAKARHQPLDGAAGDRKAFSPQLPPDLPRAVDAEVLCEDPLNLGLQFAVPLAWSNSRFSRSKAFSFSAMSVGTPARLPLSTSAFFI